MRRLIAFGAIASLAVFALAQVRGSDLLASFAKALNGAKSVSATVSVQSVGGTATTMKVALAKPNMARIDSPTQLIVADGKTITTYDKGDQTYFKKPATDADLKALFATDELNMFGSFFDANFYAKVPASKALGQKNRRGVNYTVVEANLDTYGKKVVNFYLDPADKVAKLGEFTLSDAGQKTTTIVSTKDFVLDGKQASDVFAFTAPEGSRELTMEELMAGKWYTDFSEAQSVAKKLNKPMYVDFYADWWHFCKKLEQDVYSTKEFKDAAKNWVLVKIDVEGGSTNKQLQQQYGASGLPTIKYLKADGSDFGGFVGYMPTDRVVASMNSAVGK